MTNMYALVWIVASLAASVHAMCSRACSGHGFCNTFGVCECNKGFHGGDCSFIRCPMGKAWGLITGTDIAHGMAECSGRGVCQASSGTCSCQIGFEGSACQRVICLERCSSNGLCITMEQLASNTLVAMNLNDNPPLEYSPYVMWDADMLYGCLCDNGYTGYNCLLNRCGQGDDPLTTSQTEEIQLVSCLTSYLQHRITLNFDTTLTAGTFVLGFGLLRTNPIAYNALAVSGLGTSMTEMLQSLPTIPSVTVTKSSTTKSTMWDVVFPTGSAEQHIFQPRWRVVEVQTFFCAADSGYLTLQYDKYLFSNIPSTALASDLKLKLESYSKIGSVQVSYSQGTTLCHAAGNQVTVSFDLMRDRDYIGDLPQLAIDSSNQNQRNGLFWGGLTPVVDAVATEVVKGIDTCNQVEVQSIICGATSGFFSLSFEGNTISNIPYTVDADTLRSTMLATFTTLLDIDVTYSSGLTACDPIGAGTMITIAFVIVTTNGPSGNGDLSSITSDITNLGVSGLAHASPNLLQLTATANEVVKGARCVPLSSSFAANPTQQITSTVTQGGGSFSLSFRGQTTRPIPSTASTSQVAAALTSLPAISGMDVLFTTGEACATPANVMQLTFTQEFGNLPTLTADPGTTSVVLQVFSKGEIDPVTSLASYDGTKEMIECSGRGNCDYSKIGACSCYTGYIPSNGRGKAATTAIRRDDCGAMSVTISSCPGDVPCSGHGTCSDVPDYKCTCAVGWRNGDCSERTCPFGISWFSYPSENNVAHRDMTECSNVGLCDRTTALCQCSSPYSGPACEFMACGGSGSECSGHGRCLSLAQLAPEIRVNGVVAGFTFGSDPNNPYTWEATKIQSCLCDPPYYGYDCSLVDCPHGDDPNTYLDVQEIQHIQCTATGGTFTITFREATTDPIPWNANISTLKQMLEALPTIEEISITFSGASSSVCSSSGIVSTITFIYELGALPCLQKDTTMLLDAVNRDGSPDTGSINVNCGGTTLLGQYVSVVGTREDAVCSRHGACDTLTGICICDPFFASSDGLGGPGTRGDCGFRTPLAKGSGSAAS